MAARDLTEIYMCYCLQLDRTNYLGAVLLPAGKPSPGTQHTVSEFGSHLRALWVRSQGWSCWEVETCYTYALLLHYLFTPPGGQQWGRNVFVEVCVNGGLLFQAHSGYSVCEGWCKAQRARGEHRSRCGSIVRQAGAQQGNNASYIATGGGEV